MLTKDVMIASAESVSGMEVRNYRRSQYLDGRRVGDLHHDHDTFPRCTNKGP